MKFPSLRALAIVSLLAPLLGCLPIPRAVEPRYFAPILSAVDPTLAPGVVSSRRPLRLRRVRGASHLKERIVWRRSEVEAGFYELKRWTQAPARFAEHAISAELFERRGFRRSDAGGVPSLEVELRAFEEMVDAERAALVELSVLLTDVRRLALFERTISVRRPLDSADPVALARAMGAALEEAVRQAADGIEAALP